MSIMERNFVQPFLAVLIGVGLGGGICVLGQKHLNKLAINECKAQADQHMISQRRLILIQSWVGDAYYCAHLRHLAQ